MKAIQIKKDVSLKELVILAVLLIIAVNIVFFKYILPPLKHKREALIDNCINYETEIYSKLSSIQNKQQVFNKIVRARKEIQFMKDKIALLKNKKVSVLDVGHMIKELLLKTGINVVSFNVAQIKRDGFKDIYEFDLVIDDTLKNIVYFLDAIEDYSQNMQVPSYSIASKNGLYEAKLRIEYVQVNMQ
ncbi:hypothetical protein [Hippea sp. KM1]|uniref:hypothetical protein n=1 Tax=Hippea sp. KM1 TaxID=944481 RepID=UPI00046CA430|nr:hypothetical protein [Hippea sp. KM1]